MSSVTQSIHCNSKPNPELKSFGGFFETWLHEQERDLEELKAATKAHSESTQCSAELTQFQCELIRRVMSHYENYYRVKSESTTENVLGMMSPSWRSSLEDAFLWVGGWRPSIAFHLLYSVSGLQFEAGLSELLGGVSTCDLGDLSPSQLSKIDELQRQTIREERELTEILAVHQETVADSSMVQLSHIATELMEDNSERVETESMKERVESTLGKKEDKLKEILGKADDLRLRTLKELVDILSPIQAVHFLIAAAELHLRVHDWGMKKDHADEERSC
ncbi:protein DOG1-like 3 [Amaranthus tricolor]|uniref:protein DOG1-like 3 n=1 Tax=Amaranthus tricolor TaxID=29722 RepID=UPI002587CC27|nr:protein DOG1-like 3 [Amaranthus tricolor]XP_057539141.1 protein DOG1-like 3 [Amaranthus tricolor]XP_057539142.1 protein DOG1-like 3 [Amaranthus tricolor]